MVKNKEHLIFLKQFFYLANEEIHQKTKQENFKNISTYVFYVEFSLSGFPHTQEEKKRKFSKYLLSFFYTITVHTLVQLFDMITKLISQ